MIEMFLKNSDIKTHDEVQNLLNKKRKILEKAIKQSKTHYQRVAWPTNRCQVTIQGWYDHGKDKRREIKFDKRGADNIDELYQISATSA